MPLPSDMDAQSTVLFMGSGFTRGATNIAGAHPPVGDELRDILADMLKVPREQYNLQTLADAVNRRPDLDLFQTLRSLFTISSLHPDQKTILSKRWQRIYTTNYDDAIEFAYHTNGVEVATFNYDDEKPRRVPRGAIIHLHGVIRKAAPENVLDQLVLNQSSYIRQHIATSPWYDEFLRDLRFCNACYFLGYSLGDPHIASLLMRSPEIVNKTFFIVKSVPDALLKDQVAQFGEIHPIETAGFAKLCRTLPSPPPVSDLHSLRGVRYVDPFKDQKAKLKPTPLEVLNLVTFGSFDEQRCLSTLPAAQYVVPRTQRAQEALQMIERARCLLVHLT